MRAIQKSFDLRQIGVVNYFLVEAQRFNETIHGGGVFLAVAQNSYNTTIGWREDRRIIS